MTRHDLLKIVTELRNGEALNVRLSDMIEQPPVVAFPDEPLRLIVNRMASTGLTRFPVVQPNGKELLGLIALPDLLKARELSVQEEHHREQVLRLRVPPSLRWRRFGASGLETQLEDPQTEVTKVTDRKET
jgi:predicted transcriptional regulator